jgi:hypothetical protein
MVLCGRSSDRTRVDSPRQLPTDHDYAVSTREYQSDQPSRKLPRPRLALPPKSKERRKQLLVVDRSFHIRTYQELALCCPNSQFKTTCLGGNTTLRSQFLLFGLGNGRAITHAPII